MTKTDMLLIRACKSADPMRRLQSVYRRQYLRDTGSTRLTYNALLIILTNVLDDHTKTTNTMFLNQLLAAERDELPLYTAPMRVLRYTSTTSYSKEMIWRKR